MAGEEHFLLPAAVFMTSGQAAEPRPAGDPVGPVPGGSKAVHWRSNPAWPRSSLCAGASPPRTSALLGEETEATGHWGVEPRFRSKIHTTQYLLAIFQRYFKYFLKIWNNTRFPLEVFDGQQGSLFSDTVSIQLGGVLERFRTPPLIINIFSANCVEDPPQFSPHFDKMNKPGPKETRTNQTLRTEGQLTWGEKREEVKTGVELFNRRSLRV